MPEFSVSSPQGFFRVDVEVPGKIGKCKQCVAEFVGNAILVGLASGKFFVKFVGFFADLVEHKPGVIPVKADLGGATLQFVGFLQRGECGWDVVQEPPVRVFQSQRLSFCPFFGLFLGLDPFPDPLDQFGLVTVFITEDVRMTTDHLFGYAFNHVTEVEMPVFFCHAGVVNHLQEQVSQFLAKVRHVVLGDRIGNFVGFFQGVGRDRFERLFQIPGASGNGCPQGGHDFDKTGDVTAWCHERTCFRLLVIAAVAGPLEPWRRLVDLR